jgi:hypothetical protein
VTERQAWEHELREELPALLADHEQELAARPAENRERRERIEWQIRRMQKRMAELHARLTALVFIVVTILAGCSNIPLLPTHTQDELRADCDRRRGWWRPDNLRGGYCEHDSHL